MPVVRPLAPADSCRRDSHACDPSGCDSYVCDSYVCDSYVRGRLDVTTAADLRADLLEVLEHQVAEPSVNREELVVDLSGVDAVDMVGVGLLVGVHRQAQRRGRRLVLTGVPPRVMRLLTATRLRRVLAVRDLPRPAAPHALAADQTAQHNVRDNVRDNVREEAALAI